MLVKSNRGECSTAKLNPAQYLIFLVAGKLQPGDLVSLLIQNECVDLMLLSHLCVQYVHCYLKVENNKVTVNI